MTRIDILAVPEKVKILVKHVDETFSKYKTRIFSVDMEYDTEGQPWIIEVNTKPGFNTEDSPQRTGYMKAILEALIKEI